MFLIVLSWQENIYMIRIDGTYLLSNQYPDELEFSTSISEEHCTGNSLNLRSLLYIYVEIVNFLILAVWEC